MTIPDPDGRVSALMAEIGKILEDRPVTGFSYGTGKILYPRFGPSRQYHDDIPSDELPYIVKGDGQ